jgi:fatty-acyl-CoA synthase/long-chain acyl-CoA synthetase
LFARLQAERDPEKPAVIHAPSGSVLSFGQLEWRANQLAHLLRSDGVQQRDHIALFMQNGIEMLVWEAAAERTGLYYTLVNTHLSGHEVAYIIDDCRAKVVVVSRGLLPLAAEAAPSCPAVARWFITGDQPADGPFEVYEPTLRDRPGTPVDDELLGGPMLYSSGTTGRPKGILRPLPDVAPGDPIPRYDNVRTLFGVREGMVYLSPAPLYHGAAQSSVAIALRLGATTVVMDRFDAEVFLGLVERHRVTHTQVVPTMFSRLLDLPPEIRGRFDVSSLESVVHAAAPCPVAVKEQMIDWLGPILREYYSASEANGATACSTQEWRAHPGTVGRPVFGEPLILNDDDAVCRPGETGTVWFRGATNFEYFNDPEQTAASRDATGTMSTVGDVGYCDADGYLYLTDRKSMMIISGGVNIYPQEVENLLISHPKVFDAAVIGVPSTDMGEEVRGVVQVAAGAVAGPGLEAELIAWCRSRLAHFKCPRAIDFAESLPRLPTGKMAKRVLRDRYWANAAS